MPGSAADAAEVHAGKRIVVVHVVVDLGYAIVLLAGADQAKDLSAWVGSVIRWEERFIRAGSVTRGLHGTIRVEARDVRAERCHIRKPDIVTGINKAQLTVARNKVVAKPR